MDDAAKLQLSQEELALASDPEWILTKNSIMERAVQLMARLSERYDGELGSLREIVGERLVEIDVPVNWDRPKISRGENYQGLPYVILDQPRLFTKEHVLAIRTMFWWGHYFMVTLHLKGRMCELFLPGVTRHAGALAAAGFHVATSGDEWRHELEGDNYRLLQEDSIGTHRDYPFVKLSAKCSLSHWNEGAEILLKLFQLLIQALNSPGDERGLLPGSSTAGSDL